MLSGGDLGRPGAENEGGEAGGRLAQCSLPEGSTTVTAIIITKAGCINTCFHCAGHWSTIYDQEETEAQGLSNLLKHTASTWWGWDENLGISGSPEQRCCRSHLLPTSLLPSTASGKAV